MQSLIDNKLVRFQLPFLLWALLIFVASSIPSQAFPELRILDFDKLVHAGVYFVFCALAHRAIFYQTRFPGLSKHHFLFSVIITGLYGATDELHQLFTPGRECDIFDWMADSIGGALFILLLWLWMRRRSTATGPAS